MNKDQLQPIIELQHLGVKFGKQVVHRDISFTIQEGESVTLLGPSGTGKTVILKAIIGLLRPSSGRIYVCGQEIVSAKEDQLRELRREIGMLFQGAALFDSLNVYNNVAYALRENGLEDEPQIAEIVAEKLEIVGLPGVQEKYPSQLSGGMKKRVGLARALASSPKIMLFDEPTTGLDPTSTRLIDDLIVKLNTQHGITCLSVTHDVASARRFSSRWILINNGVVVADGLVSVVDQKGGLVQKFVTGQWSEEA